MSFEVIGDGLNIDSIGGAYSGAVKIEMDGIILKNLGIHGAAFEALAAGLANAGIIKVHSLHIVQTVREGVIVSIGACAVRTGWT